MSKTAALLHLNAQNNRVFFDELIASDDYYNLLTLFVKKIGQLQLPVFLAVDPQLPTAAIEKVLAEFAKENIQPNHLKFYHELPLIFQLFDDKTLEDLVFFSGIFPLFDLQVYENLYEIHLEYKADYSFAENMPAGLCPSFFNRTFCEQFRLTELADRAAIPQDFPMALDFYLEKNINKYHVEIHYEEPDLRMLRLNFSLADKRSLIKTHRLAQISENLEAPFQSLEPLLKKKPEILFVFPSYIEWEIISECEFQCSFCPRQFTEFSAQKSEKEDLKKICEFLMLGPGDSVVTLGGMGEPLQHPDILHFIAEILKQEKLRMLIVETNGKYLSKMHEIINAPNFAKLRFVINLNSLQHYQDIHGSQDFTLADLQSNLKNFINILKQKLPNQNLAHNIIIQMLKIEENENETEAIYAFAEELGVTFLLQKYNRYIDLMPEKRVSDMTPLERFPCWHLRRDLYIRANGDVGFCKQDLMAKQSRGNIRNQELTSIWSTQQLDFQADFQGRLAQKPNCNSCDEYFTFNF